VKTAGFVKVAVPECDKFWCSPCNVHHSECPYKKVILWQFTDQSSFLKPHYIPGPTCPAFDSVPNPWADEYPDRPWDDEAEEQLIDVQLLRLKSAGK